MEGVPLDDHERWMSRDLEEGENAGFGRAMGWRRDAVTSYCSLRGGKGIGR